MFERLIYTNSAGKAIEFSTASIYHTNIRKDVSGLFGVDATIFTSEVVGIDGAIETGIKIGSRDIQINGTIKTRVLDEQDSIKSEMALILSPLYTGTLRYEGKITAEIDVRIEKLPEPKTKVGVRWPSFSIDMVALDPNWRLSYEKTATVADSGTDIYYEGTKPCGIIITMTAGADSIDMESFTIQHGDDTKTITFRTGGGIDLDTGDTMILDTTPGAVNITLNDETAFERLDRANCYFPFELYPGVNTISWLANGDEADFSVTIAYTPLYLGV